MKIKNLLTAFTLVAFVVALNSCKKNKDADEFETTFELSGDQAIADNLTQDANDVLNEAAIDKNLMGNRPGGTSIANVNRVSHVAGAKSEGSTGSSRDRNSAGAGTALNVDGASGRGRVTDRDGVGTTG